MVGNSIIHVSTNSTVLPLYMMGGSTQKCSMVWLPPLKLSRRSRKGGLCVKAESTSESGEAHESSLSSERKSLLAGVWDVPGVIWRKTLQPLSDFGFGRRSIWEGGVGFFLVSGTVLLALSLAWLRGFQLRSRFRKYMALFEFDQACGICTGTPVRIRGVTVGNVIRVNSSLKSIEAIVEIEDDKIIIPKNSIVEVNQSGLLMETLIDITPQNPIPTPSVGPLDADCGKEGFIVCHRQKIKGYQGVSLDAMIGLFTRLGGDVEGIGVANVSSLVKEVSSVIEESQPLLRKIKAMADDIQPLLAEANASGMLKDVESLTKSLTQLSEDVR